MMAPLCQSEQGCCISPKTIQFTSFYILMFSFFFKRIEMSTKEKVVPPPDGSSLIFSKFCLCGHLFNKHCKGLLSMSSVTIWPSYHFHKWYYLSSYLYKVQKENSWNKDENNFEAAKSSFLHLDLFSTEVFVFASLKTSLRSVFLSCLACNAQGACEEGATNWSNTSLHF